jgi:hypothetical protein
MCFTNFSILRVVVGICAFVHFFTLVSGVGFKFSFFLQLHQQLNEVVSSDVIFFPVIHGVFHHFSEKVCQSVGHKLQLENIAKLENKLKTMGKLPACSHATCGIAFLFYKAD